MIRFAADENFNNDIVRGLLRERPELDIVRIQDAGLSSVDDPTILEWASQENRILLTHDVNTITHYAYERIHAGKLMPGVLEIKRLTPIRTIIDDILLLVDCSFDNEWENQIRYLPLR